MKLDDQIPNMIRTKCGAVVCGSVPKLETVSLPTVTVYFKLGVLMILTNETDSRSPNNQAFQGALILLLR